MKSHYINRDAKTETSRRCDNCNIDVHRESFAKHIKNEELVENVKQDEIIIPEWLFQKPIEKKH